MKQATKYIDVKTVQLQREPIINCCHQLLWEFLSARSLRGTKPPPPRQPGTISLAGLGGWLTSCLGVNVLERPGSRQQGSSLPSKPTDNGSQHLYLFNRWVFLRQDRCPAELQSKLLIIPTAENSTLNKTLKKYNDTIWGYFYKHKWDLYRSEPQGVRWLNFCDIHLFHVLLHDVSLTFRRSI